jgi:hypothetical protein
LENSRSDNADLPNGSDCDGKLTDGKWRCHELPNSGDSSCHELPDREISAYKLANREKAFRPLPDRNKAISARHFSSFRIGPVSNLKKRCFTNGEMPGVLFELNTIVVRVRLPNT